MSDRIAVMDSGVVRQVADPTTLYEFPHDRFVASFIGQTNMFSGRVESVEGDRVTLRTRRGRRSRHRAGSRRGELRGSRRRQAEKLSFGSDGDNVLSARSSSRLWG